MKLKYLIELFIMFGVITIIGIGCSSSKYFPECGDIIKSSNTEYLVSGLMDHTELKKEWIKEEIKRDSVENWIKNYIYKQTSKESIDNIYLKNWRKIKSNLNNGDRVFYYSTPKEYWDVLAGQDGLVVLRNCKIIYIEVLWQS